MGNTAKSAGDNSKKIQSSKVHMAAKVKDKLSKDTTALEKKIREHIRQAGQQSKRTVNKGKGKISAVDNVDQKTKEKKANSISNGGIFQYQLKEPPDMEIEEEIILDETGVIQQLRKDITLFEGSKNSSSNENKEGGYTRMEAQKCGLEVDKNYKVILAKTMFEDTASLLKEAIETSS
ncbi:hypothetical protein ACOSQ4_012805 [Xanthoceras sorbifolium]